MLISFNWLKEHVNLPESVSAEAVAEKLKMSTVEVEKIDNQGKNLTGIVVGKVIRCEQHPNADKLKVCTVEVGSERLTVVCGGSNVRVGMVTAVATVGAMVRWHGQGEPVELQPTKIRGVESQGMICAADEIGLLELFPKKEEKEIVDLGGLSALPGVPLAAALNLDDTIFEIDNKSLSNRPDLWGHHGLAREVAALFSREVKPYPAAKFKPGKALKLSAAVADSKFCPKIMFVAVTGVTIAPSPRWLQKKLIAIGQRPINNIVDITNYVMFDLGKPMHAFDARALETGNQRLQVQVRPAVEGEMFTLLDGRTLALDAGCSVVASQTAALALAGIMGGEKSGVKPDTAAIVFETAIFDAAAIRRTAARFGVRSDSSVRFEKSLDPAWCELSLARAVELTKKICPGAQVVSNVASVGAPRLPRGPVIISEGFFTQKLGCDVPLKDAVNTLQRLGFTVIKKKKELSVTIPTWRATKDIAIPEDIVEEVARFYGYNRIPAELPIRRAGIPPDNARRALEYSVRDILTKTLGLTEVYNYSFVSRVQIQALGEAPGQYLELDNPLSQEKPYLRRYLVSNLLENVAHNSGEYPLIRLFEIGKVYRSEQAGLRVAENSDALLPGQDTHCTAVIADRASTELFWEARRVAEAVAAALWIDWRYAAPASVAAHPWQHPGRTAVLEFGGAVVGYVYELHPQTITTLGLPGRAAVCSFNLSKLSELLPAAPRAAAYRPPALYPPVKRDVALEVSVARTYQEIRDVLTTAHPLLTSVHFFDVYNGKGQLAAGKKSLAFHLIFSHPERTLTASEVEAAEQKIIKKLADNLGAEIRT